MRRRLATTRVTLQEQFLPPSTERTELNYRTCITTKWQGVAATVRLLSILTLIFIAIGFGIRLFDVLPLAWGVGILFVAGVAMLVVAYAKFLQKRPPWSGIGWCLGFLAACLMFGVTSFFAPTPERPTSGSSGSQSQGSPCSRISSRSRFAFG